MPPPKPGGQPLAHRLIRGAIGPLHPFLLLRVCRRYKAYFRWPHYSHKLRSGTALLPTETDACPSVTAAFLQVQCGTWKNKYSI